jgi:hypothetical protein
MEPSDTDGRERHDRTLTAGSRLVFLPHALMGALIVIVVLIDGVTRYWSGIRGVGRGKRSIHIPVRWLPSRVPPLSMSAVLAADRFSKAIVAL